LFWAIATSTCKMKLIAFAAAPLFLAACAESSLMNNAESHKGRGFLSQAQRTKLLMPEKSALDGMEASLLGMAKQKMDAGDSENAANLTSFLTQIQDIIDQTMKTSILTRYNASQQMLDSTWSNYTATCDSPGDAPFSQYTFFSNMHVSCRATEQTYYQSYTSCLSDESIVEQATEVRCGTYNSLNTMTQYASLCSMPAGMAAPTIGNYLIHMESVFRDALSNLADARDSCTNVSTTPAPVTCDNLHCDWAMKQYDCDTMQQVWENQACVLSREYTCSIYTSCMSAKKNAYDQAHVTANTSQPGLKAEWRSVMRIECLIGALDSPADQLQSQIDACIARTHSTLPVTFTFYGPTSPVPACNQANYQNMTPGNAAFSTRWYAGITDVVDAIESGRQVGLPLTCASSTCDCWNGTAPLCVASAAGLSS